MKSTIIATTAALFGSILSASITTIAADATIETPSQPTKKSGLRSARSHHTKTSPMATDLDTTSTSKPVFTSELRSLDSSFVVHENDQIAAYEPARITSRGRLSIEGDHSTLHARQSMEINGLLYFEPGANVRRTAPIVVDGELVINPRTARISIEASSYHGATGLFELIHFNDGHMGEFVPSNIVILGLDHSLAAEVIFTQSSLSLMIHPNPKYSSLESSLRHQNAAAAADNKKGIFKETSKEETNMRFYSI
uniref:TNase-like domain-containing protein n=1 Tax=Craspedostauros australis TaxID=1486917 RepID=A0A7R9WVH7_9STRA|eukprot:CAMPEP_0198132416 /NCGR_PEP_ID=MMETSP1442-20131203/58292_1 /TAXON_ID= /ORGANISM="Craspedostauros australis, Strain CCMP3328" /LENGTH=252 /DNA_ID=CAMNT_0043793415 /DNA_START=70 /DNA_END=828 /DNA_ORIENTATION=+